jgi:hypothetical protein
MKTGKDVTQAGSYASRCCLVELKLAEQQMAPRCPKCMKLTVWEDYTIRRKQPKSVAA